MPKQRSANRAKAREIYIKNKDNISITEIAKTLNETPGTVRGWKAKDKWDNILKETLQTKDTKRSEKRSEKTAKRSKQPERSEKISTKSCYRKK